MTCKHQIVIYCEIPLRDGWATAPAKCIKCNKLTVKRQADIIHTYEQLKAIKDNIDDRS